MTASELFNKVLDDNNLAAELTEPRVRFLKDGAMLIEQPLLRVTFKSYEKEIETQTQTRKEKTNGPKK